ncbi:DUF4355 domain-containing protein [Ligilactobacillus murinus]|uniref:DUF4355 domain-containing protein n=1 Tax=Ligilactobacillus murinus TaxID=1622 RepID=UPI00096EC661|nr:DUF4355 domain-containing protein [Ligilactobacillus murinus]
MNEEELNEQETLPEKESKEKTFTQDEVDRIVSDRLKRGEDKLRAKLLEEAKQQVREEQDEAKKLEEMNANQRKKYEDEKRDNELKELRATIQRQNMEKTAMGILKEKGISVDEDVLDLVVADSAEKTAERIDKFAELVEVKAREIRRQDFSNSAPKQSGSGEKVVTLDDFKKMAYPERLELKKNQPDLYQELVQKSF